MSPGRGPARGGGPSGAYDVVVIGGGIAGVSVAYELAADHSVAVVEAESTLAYHTTGRSAATFLESYGPAAVRALTVASRSFFDAPPPGFHRPLLSSRGTLWCGRVGARDAVAGLVDDVAHQAPSVQLLDGPAAERLCPILRSGVVEAALYEPDAADIDVATLHQGYVRGLTARGGEIHPRAGVVRLQRSAGRWIVDTTAGGRLAAATVVNAAGAWCDEVAALAGVRGVGIRPLRRTLFTCPAPSGLPVAGLPLVADVGGSFYLKPEGHQLLGSPADETPSPPLDAKPEEIDVARALDAINEFTTLGLRHVRTAWAGLRSFVADGVPVVGPDPDADGFVWLAGQGGYGIQAAPALATLTASLVRGRAEATPVAPAALSVARIERQPRNAPSGSDVV